MPLDLACITDPSFVAMADEAVATLRGIESRDQFAPFMAEISRGMGFRHYAVIHHDDLRNPAVPRVDVKDYPAAVVERLIGESRYRRDPVIRGCLFAGGAFLWSELDRIIDLDRRDRECFRHGAREGLNEGITVPFFRLGDCMGSCTFAGIVLPDAARRYLGVAQMIGIFAFQAALRVAGGATSAVRAAPRLHPRPRDCVVLAGRGLSNKEIARALSLTPRTVDGYLTEARALLGAQDRTELVVGAVLAGEVGLHELRGRQPR